MFGVNSRKYEIVRGVKALSCEKRLWLWNDIKMNMFKCPINFTRFLFRLNMV